jgi:hypothetical protein
MFENDFYSDADCRFVRFSKGEVDWVELVRNNWNKGNPHRTPFQRDLDRLVFSGAFRRLQAKPRFEELAPDVTAALDCHTQ